MTTTDIHALIGAYALDAVDDLERAAFERHLRDCSSCLTDVSELREAATRLADNTWSAPPPRMRADVMAAIGRTRQLPPADTGNLRTGREAPTVRWRARVAAYAAALVLAAGTGATVYAVQEQRVREQSITAAEARQREARTQAVLAAPDLRVHTAPMTGGGRVTVASSAAQGAAVVSVRADTVVGPDQALQLWTIRGTEKPVSAEVLAAGRQQAAYVVDGIPDHDVVAVSLEPAGGSAQPTNVLAKVVLA
ncbi:anti-sigma factor [Actinoplanes utahensis]|uniref:Regulator of SigK n=1 Tax=Actinoplanes utahensis TaxID=1869 RepID=A0A0A6UKJ1_ACTUT|nr:anti-sigma factor [Actinoplanes utahensis]KHD75961.1 anti-sigma factor [Actinoplanes utahensis]GIF35068.1 hypothetical protein Aut01nite_80540 [Actinoplanes utahensis]